MSGHHKLRSKHTSESSRVAPTRSTSIRRLPPVSGVAQLQKRLGNQGLQSLLADRQLNEQVGGNLGLHGETNKGVPPGKESTDIGAGLPDTLQAGLEQLSNYDLSDVRVHRNSDKPSQYDAEAYTQGENIYMAPGQEKHLAHEGWHVVQQKQGRVSATRQDKGLTINQDIGLEREADVMGAKAGHFGLQSGAKLNRDFSKASAKRTAPQDMTVQLSPKSIPTSKGPDQRVGAKIPDVAKQKEIGAKLDPNAYVMTPVTPPIKPGTKTRLKPVMVPKRVEWTGLMKFRDHLKQRAALESGLLKALGSFLKSAMPGVNAEKAKTRVPMMKKGRGKFAGKDVGVQGVADAASNVLEKRYSMSMKAAIRTPAQAKSRNAPMSADPKSAGQNLFDAYSKTARKKAVNASSDYDLAFGVGYWAIKHNANATRHTNKHHFSPEWNSGKSDWVFLETVVKKFIKKSNNQTDMIDYRLYMWNETTPSGIMLLTTFDPSVYAGNKVKAERATRWGIFSTAIHETVHFRTHPSFDAAQQGRSTMAEGFVEMFAKDAADPAFKTVRSGGNKPLRYAVEGFAVPLDVSVIPSTMSVASDYLADWKNAVAIRKKIGEAAVRAAFFQGHVEYLGLDPMGADLPGLSAKGTKPTIRRPLGVNSLAALSKASGLDVALIKAANPGITNALMPRLVLPGCREHIVVGTKDSKGNVAIEKRRHIAAQHGVSETDLVRANPGVPINKATNSWGRLKIGQKFLIPRH